MEKIFIKKFIYDDGKVRRCTSNIAKMNVFEWIYFYIKDWGCFRDIWYFFNEMLFKLIDGFKNIGLFVINIIMLIFLPVTLFVAGYLEIKKARKE